MIWFRAGSLGMAQYDLQGAGLQVGFNERINNGGAPREITLRALLSHPFNKNLRGARASALSYLLR